MSTLFEVKGTRTPQFRRPWSQVESKRKKENIKEAVYEITKAMTSSTQQLSILALSFVLLCSSSPHLSFGTDENFEIRRLKIGRESKAQPESQSINELVFRTLRIHD